MDVISALQDALGSSLSYLGEALPKLLSALVILLIGYFVAKSLKWAIEKLLRAVKFDSLADKVGINNYLAKGGMSMKASGLMAKLVYYFIWFTVLGLFFNALGLTVVVDLLNQVILFIPNIMVACVLLIIGMYLAEFVQNMVETALKGSNFGKADLVGNIAYGAIMFFVGAMVLTQLGIGGDIIQNVVTIVLGGLGLAVGLAFGLGGKDWAARMIDKIDK